MIDKKIVIYLLKIIWLYLVWYIVYTYWLGPDGRVDYFLNHLVARCGHDLVKLIGYESCIEGVGICVKGVATVHIGNGCNGLELYAIFTGFMLLFEGKPQYKFIYIVAGLIVIFGSNVLRVAMLAIDNYHDIKLFRFNHKYTYVFVLYSIIFGLWALWILKFSKKDVVAD